MCRRALQLGLGYVRRQTVALVKGPGVGGGSRRALSGGDGEVTMPTACESVPFCFQHVTMIGAGKMAESIASAVLAKSLCPPESITVYDINKDRLSFFETTFGTKSSDSISDALKHADLILFAVKPQNANAVFSEMMGRTQPSACLLSIMAGVTVDDIVAKTGSRRVVRSMPNTPATIQEGMTVWCATPELTQAEKNSVARLLSCMGDQQFVTDESFLDMATAVSGSGPAYVLLVLEALIDSAVHLGFPRNMAERLAFQTVLGTTKYAITSTKHVAMLRNDITSPGGTTASALYVLEKGSFRTVLADGIWAAYRRSLELGGLDSRVGPGRSKFDSSQDLAPKKN